MKGHGSRVVACTVALLVWASGPSAAPFEGGPIELVVASGRPLRVALERRIRVKRVGQPVRGLLVEPVYSYDRLVLPAGTRVLGHVARLEGVPQGVRLRAILGADFTPLHHVVLQFDSLVLDDGRVLPIHTEVRSATARVALRVRDTPGRQGLAARAGEEVAQEAKQALSAIKEASKLQTLKYTLISALPYHPQYLRAGTVYTADLTAPLSFGTGEATQPALPGTAPPAGAILHTRLLTALHSARSPRGSPVQAVVTQPLFSSDHRLILPEGTLLTGEVTFARAAARFHRNGQLRFLFESVQAPQESAETLRASLYSVQAGRDERVALDDEGGATITNSKARFIAPALTGLALAATMHRRLDYDTDGLGPEAAYGSVESRGIGGLFGFGLIGAALSQVSRQVAVGIGIIGMARTLFVSVVGKGRDVSFPTDTTMEVQLGPGPGPGPRPEPAPEPSPRREPSR